jgi:hypothetical protein
MCHILEAGEMHSGIFGENLREGDQLEDLDVDGSIRLK